MSSRHMPPVEEHAGKRSMNARMVAKYTHLGYPTLLGRIRRILEENPGCRAFFPGMPRQMPKNKSLETYDIWMTIGGIELTLAPSPMRTFITQAFQQADPPVVMGQDEVAEDEFRAPEPGPEIDAEPAETMLDSDDVADQAETQHEKPARKVRRTARAAEQTVGNDRFLVLHTEAGVPMADSRDVAKYFGKEHSDVLKAIRALNCSVPFKQGNFVTIYINTLDGKQITSHVMMAKDGFMFLTMGFTGEAAGRLKENWLAKYNALERERGADVTALTMRMDGLTTNVERMMTGMGRMADTVSDLMTKVGGLIDAVSSMQVYGRKQPQGDKWPGGQMTIKDFCKAHSDIKEDRFRAWLSDGGTYNAGAGLGYIEKNMETDRWVATERGIKEGYVTNVDFQTVTNGVASDRPYAVLTSKGVGMCSRALGNFRRSGGDMFGNIIFPKDDHKGQPR